MIKSIFLAWRERLRASPWRHGLHWRVFAYGGAAFFAALLVYLVYLDITVRSQFEGKRFALPARVYARALELFPPMHVTPQAVLRELELLHYKPGLSETEVGRFEVRDGEMELVTRPFTFWDGVQPSQRVVLRFDEDKLIAIKGPDRPIDLLRLDPAPIGGIYPAHNEDRILVKLSEVPKHLIDALIATEDKRFYHHPGVDARAMARALSSLFGGRRAQGGSTLTQQLVKNFFLTPERTLSRKAREVLMALLLEVHYDKDEILETYLNEIYLGQDRNRAIHGFGLAAQYYFGKPVAQLGLAEAALLVGMVKGPSYYDPHRSPARALERRNVVLSELKNQGYIAPEVFEEAKAQPLSVGEKVLVGTSPHPAFLDLVRRQLKRDYREDDLRSEGLQIFTTLDPHAQAAAEKAVTNRLALLDANRDTRARKLEGAVVMTHTQTGEVQALVGGRQANFEGFNRALDATRPVGSLLKPVIFLTALERPSDYNLVTLLDDSAFTWKARGAKDWEPKNYDKKEHGQVPLRLALAHSYNLSSARLGLDLGIAEVLQNVRRLGVESHELPPYAATLLGAVEITPFEVTRLYQTIASGGFKTPLRAIREVLTAGGQPLQRYSLSVEQVFDPAPIYLLTHALQDVVREGTAQGLKNYLPASLAAAGKTGTTDELRDSWFVGFTGDRLAVTWVGYDDNAPSLLTGSSGAMTVWGEMMKALTHEPLQPPMPENVEVVWIDPGNGLRADADCAGAIELPFIQGSAPTGLSDCITPVVKPDKDESKKSWWQRLFGR